MGDLNDFGQANAAYDNSESSNYSKTSGNFALDILMGTGKSTTFTGYTESFPLSLEEYFLKDRDRDGTLLLPKAIPLKDLKEIQSTTNHTYSSSSRNRSNNNSLTSLWIEVARVYLHEGLLQDAEAAVNQAYLCNEIFAPIFGSFGLIEEARGGLENIVEAETFFRKGISIDSNDEICLLGLSRVLILSKDPSKLFECECLVRRLIEKDPSIAEAWSILAQCCSGTNRNTEALKYFEVALKRESQCPLRSFRSLI